MPSHAAVLGRPVAHSLSPVLHRAAYAELGLPWTYTAIECDAAGLPGVLAARTDWAGFSCTMPLKHAALDVAAEATPVAVAVGAANTLLPVAGGWQADNTDAEGLAAALREHGIAPATATVLGGGGTAQAALAALRGLGLTSCAVVVRDLGRLDALHGTARRLGLDVRATTFDDATGALAADLVISTLPPRAADGVPTSAPAVLDVVYAGWPTPFAAAAREQGATVVSGALMLLHQAAAQVRLMTGAHPPVEAMRAALAGVVPGSGV